MRRAIALGGFLVMLGSWAGSGVPAEASSPPLHTVAGRGGVGSLNAPSGITVDSSGDLFIADTDHCRVVLVPAHPGSMYGMHVRAHHAYTVAGRNCGAKGGIGFPTGVAVDRHGDVYIADATGNRVLEVRPGGEHGPHSPTTVAGTGVAGYSGNGQLARQSMLDEPTGIAVNAAGDLFVADTANCRVRMVPAVSGVHYGQSMTAADLYTVAGTGTCGSNGRPGPASQAQLWNPMAVAVDAAGDVFIAGNGDQTVDELAVRSGTYYGTSIAGGDVATIVGVVGDGNTPYLADGFSATGVAPEMNDPEGLAVGPSGTLFVTDGSMHCIRVVPNSTSDVFGRSMTGGDMYTLAGALPVTKDGGLGDGTRWILTHVGDPIGIALSPSDAVIFSDHTDNQVREIG